MLMSLSMIYNNKYTDELSNISTFRTNFEDFLNSYGLHLFRASRGRTAAVTQWSFTTFRLNAKDHWVTVRKMRVILQL